MSFTSSMFTSEFLGGGASWSLPDVEGAVLAVDRDDDDLDGRLPGGRVKDISRGRPWNLGKVRIAASAKSRVQKVISITS